MLVRKQDDSVESYIKFFFNRRIKQNNEDDNPDSIRNWVPLKKLGSDTPTIEGQTGETPPKTEVIYSGSSEVCQELCKRIDAKLSTSQECEIFCIQEHVDEILATLKK
jgi:hypothetical protein